MYVNFQKLLVEIVAVVLLAVAMFGYAPAQADDALDKANAVFSEAQGLAEPGTAESWKAAEPKFNEAYALFAKIDADKKTNYVGEFAKVLYSIGNRQIEAERYELSANYFNFGLGKTRGTNLKSETANFLDGLGNVNVLLEKVPLAIDYYKQALNIFLELKDQTRAAAVYRQLGLVAYDDGKLDAAVANLEQSLKLYQALKDRETEAATLEDIGDAHFDADNYSKAEVSYQNAAVIFAELKDLAGEMKMKAALGKVRYYLYRSEEAIQLLKPVIAYYESTNDKESLADVLLQIGKAFTIIKSFEDGRKALTRSADLYRELKSRVGEANALLHLGSLEMQDGKPDAARSSREKALELYTLAKFSYGMRLANVSLAEIHSYTNDYDKAIGYAEAARKVAETENTKDALWDAYQITGWVLILMSRYDEAIRYTSMAVKLAEELKSARRRTESLTNLGIAYSSLGMRGDSIRYYRQALELTKETGDRVAAAILHSNIGYNYYGLRDLQNARKYLEEALPKMRAEKMTREIGYTTHNLGMVQIATGDMAGAETSYKTALAIYIEVKDRRPEAYAYLSLGELHTIRKQWKEAAAYLEKALQLSREIKYADIEANTLSWMMAMWRDREQPRLAILYGKQAVNVFQSVRTLNRGLQKTALAAYIKHNDAAYRELADLLISQGRLPEAQQVFDLLKEEEIFDYLRRDASEADKLLSRVDLRAEETEALKRYNIIAEKIGSLGAEFGKLQQAKNSLAEGASLPAADQKRYDELAKQLEEANAVFQVFLRQLADEFAKKPSVVGDVQENAGLQADLRSWGDGVVSLYTIAGEDRYRVILTTPDIQTDGKTEIKAADLNKKIADFRAAIQNPRIDPRPLGKELYDIIVRPIEKQLEGAKAKTLLWSLDGALRYVPLAALWDGKQYFGQKYQNVLITLASRTRLSEEPKSDWRVLGLGVTTAKEVTEPNGTRILSFSALPSVGTELAAIVRDEQKPGDTGVLIGKRLLDAEFTEQTLKDRLGRGYQAVHIASHFSFRPGDMTRSFLLLGDGKALTMDKVKTSPQLKFNGVELLTLSACDTAVGDADANGKEIESFGVIAQQNGAKAVMATLWPVVDESTSKFMAEFYRLKKENPQMTKTEAIRLAQKQMIEGKIINSGTAGKCRADEFVTGGKETTFKCDPNAPFSHPYFWSPFVLIGNWR